jgi:hypothetical protein
MTDRTSYIEGLRKLAGLLEQHPELKLPYSGSGTGLSVIPVGDERGQLAAWARVLARHGRVEKNVRGSYFDLDGSIAGLHIKVITLRDEVCTRVVTGTEEREVEEEVEPAVTRTVTRKVDVVEWQCEPLLGASGASA